MKLAVVIYASVLATILIISPVFCQTVGEITIYSQNTALLPQPFFKGESKTAIIDGVIAFLKDKKPDIVGLSEVWLEDERNQIIDAVIATYPHAVQGPPQTGLNFLGAGTLILSKFPFVTTDKSVYKSCAGEDCTTNKGIVFVRIQPPTGSQFDIFLTHTQNPSPDLASNSNGRAALSKQLDHLADFVMAKRDHHIPAIVIGDLNINGDEAGDYKELVDKMQFTVDAWKDNHPTEVGFTFDYRSCFKGQPFNCASVLGNQAGCTEDAFKSCDDLRRGVSGHRLDYFLGYSGLGVDPVFRQTEIIKIILPNQRDLSDHMGLLTKFSTSPQPPPSNDPIQKVTVQFQRFQCLTATDGPLNPLSSFVGDDEIEAQLTIEANGAVQNTGRSSIFEDVDTGSIVTVNGPILTVSNPTTDLRIQPNLWEIDEGTFIVTVRTGEANLNMEGRTLTLNDLRLLRGKQMTFATRGTGDNSEYVARVLVSVDYPPTIPPTSPPHACAGQFPGPEGCLNQYLKISAGKYEPNSYVRWKAANSKIARGKFSATLDNNRWDFGAPGPGGSFQIKSKSFGLCMFARRSGRQLKMIPCGQCASKGANKCKWEFLGEDVTAATQIRHSASRKCLSVPKDPDCGLELKECCKDADQVFHLEHAPV